MQRGRYRAKGREKMELEKREGRAERQERERGKTSVRSLVRGLERSGERGSRERDMRILGD